MKTYSSSTSRAQQRSLHAVLCGLLVLLAGAFASVTAAQTKMQDKAGEIDSLFSSIRSDAPGCVVGVSLNGDLILERAYGLADLERDVPLNASSLFDVGSLQKQFVAAAALLLVDSGHMSLSEDIRTYIPELPDSGHTITVDHLLTHTSGIRDWTGIARIAGEDEEAMALILRQRGLNFAPGEEWSYSNSGYVLLKEMIARTSGVPFSEFAHSRLFEPLGMDSTRYLDDMREVVKNRALAYERVGGHWKLDMLLDNDRGGGALLSTAGDLIIWNDALTSARLGSFVTEKLHEPARLNNGRELGYARGLSLDTSDSGGRVVWHTGGAAGYKAILARFPEQSLSIAILCNAGDESDRGVARQIVDLFVPDVIDDEAEASEGVEVDVRDRAGLYFSEGSGEPMRLVARKATLQIAGGPALVAISEDRFRNPEGTLQFMSQDEFELRFESSDEFVLTSMEGATTRYVRAEPVALDPARLRAFAGRFGSEEIGAVFQISPGARGLIMQHETSPDKRLELMPIGTDTFQRGMFLVRFRRNADGHIEALEFSNPMLRNVRFTRLGKEDVGR